MPTYSSAGLGTVEAENALAAARLFGERLAFNLHGEAGLCIQVRQLGQGKKGDYDCLIGILGQEDPPPPRPVRLRVTQG